MDYIQITFHPVALYQLAAFPCAVLYCYLCSYGHLPTTLRYLYLLVGGVILASTSMGHYAILLFFPALGSTVLFHTASSHSIHRWAFLLQMAWQTVCHLWVMYRQYYLQEIMTIKLSITISSLMLLTQKITSLAMDIHEKKVTVSTKDMIKSKEKERHHLPACTVLAVLSYLLYFPALLGGPLCSFMEFQQQISNSKACDNLWRIWTVIKTCTLFFLFHTLQGILFQYLTFQYNLTDCRQWECVYVMWSTALLFRLTYYSHWMLDEALLYSAGFYIGACSHTAFTDSNIYTLETTNKISLFARTWNKSTTKWLRRLIFQNCSTQPLLSTFAFSAWWHGLYPGQIFGFVCWAVMVEADYRIHAKLGIILKSPYIRFLCKIMTWFQTQMIIAFIMLAIEMRNLTMLKALLSSYNSLFPFFYCVTLIFLMKIKP
ncbi:membrane-bound ghrelin O-acyltransferase MBOAT4 [Rhinoderma darwinii]|uniref:membrane-bound ghrelin O-acyltransferase MBOAT4 n=1 Tax=Rhinoderma darwinii TaxID=43563 RepID=UPI003F66D154